MLLFTLFLLNVDLCFAERPMRHGTVSGRIVFEKETVFDGLVVLFFNDRTGPAPAPGKFWRMPDFGGPIEADGSLRVILDPGRYFFGVVYAPREKVAGKPELKDWRYLAREKDGSLRKYNVKSRKNTDLGVITITLPFTAPDTGDVSMTVIEGVVKNKTGKPVKDVVVEVLSLDTGRESPLFSSEMTGSDGKYFVRVLPGDYSLQVRALNRPGNQPQGKRGKAGTGYYALENPLSLTINKEESKKTVNMTVIKIF